MGGALKKMSFKMALFFLLERVFIMNFRRENVDKLLDLTNQLVDYLDPSLVQSNEFSVHLTH